jgi:hypothetical protein
MLSVTFPGQCFDVFAQRSKPAKGDETTFVNDPNARALYDKMIETIRSAKSLSYTSAYRWESSKTGPIGQCTYKAWLQKPNQFRIETTRRNGQKSGTLIGDGNYLWIFWDGDRPFFSSEDHESYEKTRNNVFIMEHNPLARHSIGHKTGLLGAGMSMPILDPSTFHGYTDSLQKYIDGLRSIGQETIADELCDVIEVSIMKGQRSWYLWLARSDHLPRKLKQIVHVSYDITMYEDWSDIVLDAPVPAEHFVWQPPEDWKQWCLPGPEERLLKPGQEAPDFEFALVDGKTFKLSNHRGKIVWLYIWRAG